MLLFPIFLLFCPARPFYPTPCTRSSYARASAALRGSGCGMKPENSALGSAARAWSGSEEGNQPLQTLNGRFPASAWKSLGFPAVTELQKGPRVSPSGHKHSGFLHKPPSAGPGHHFLPGTRWELGMGLPQPHSGGIKGVQELRGAWLCVGERWGGVWLCCPPQ